MSKTQDKLFANLVKQLPCALLLEPLTRVVTLAAVALGGLRRKRLQGGQSIPALPLEGLRDRRKQRGPRLLQNSAVEVAG